MLYTQEEVLTLARRRASVGIADRTFKAWRESGFFPMPIPSDRRPGQRGHVAYLYSEQTVDAVTWLATHRRFIRDGDEVARFWMWMERFDYVAVDPRAVLLGRIQAAWHTAQGHMPSLPDIATAAERGIADSERDKALDDLQAHVVEPRMASRTLAAHQSGTASIAALLFDLLPSAVAEGGAGNGKTFVQDTIEPLLTPEGQTWRDTVADHLPRALKAGQLLQLYRLVTDEQFNPEVVRAAWQMLTPDSIRMLGWALALFRPLRAQDAGRMRDRADLLRLLHYDPLVPLAIAAEMADVAQALQGSRQVPAELSGQETTTS